ncbi:DUF5696 domain-containing protein [Paenibacillus spongiae]|uniref:DUF5696 domain-containing protein n=1 Tax=Paenibacillus spongiae TaxID=2909671 RepID=A0ABY5S0D6_9BACL|nr:DUF5696 domain-containing protein [Paenibacillus spongiae]UVI27306.1 DUF5696 domain-containing protein [Paenibacillus spongiae]
MVKRLWPASLKLRAAYLLVLAIVISAAAIIAAKWDSLPRLEDMNIGSPPDAMLPVIQGVAWKPPAADADGFALVTENERFALLLDPRTSQIAVRNKQNGFLWRSNPESGKLGEETVKGMLLDNLQSPYVLEYVSGTETKRSVTNTRDPKLKIAYVQMTNGIQATYAHTGLELSFAIQYTLTEHGLEAAIPSEGIQETGGYKIFAISLLPFFGAVSGVEEEGYLFVPDGPGGLIRYDRKRPSGRYGYEFPIYGIDPANLKNRDQKTQREPISYPVFGLKRGDQAFAAIVKEGKYAASVKALPAGMVSTYHSLSANFSYREEYGRKVSGVTDKVVNTVQKERIRQDRRVEYRLLSGSDANYSGMAAAYRSYLEDNGELARKLSAADRMPLQLSLIAGGTKPRFGGYSYEPATTFGQAEQIVEELKSGGVANLRVTYQGWQNSGYAETDKRFPIAAAIGGNDGAKRFVDRMHEQGVKVLFEDYMAWKNPKHSAFSVKSDGIRSIDSTVLQEREAEMETNALTGGGIGRFIVNPVKAIRAQKETIDTLKAIGADGIHYVEGPGNLVYADYNPRAPLSRQDTAFYYTSLMDYTRSQLGSVGVYRGNDYSLGHADFIEELPTESSYDFIIDETVPFYPMVVHGAVEYTATAANLRSDYDSGLLKAIEYGAIPYFKLTYSPSRTLKETDYDYIYSSEYAIWKDRILDEYSRFNKLAAVYNQRMIHHEKTADGIFVTTYEDGTRVTVNYKTISFDVAGGGAQ